LNGKVGYFVRGRNGFAIALFVMPEATVLNAEQEQFLIALCEAHFSELLNASG
jgi:hypothetical protein